MKKIKLSWIYGVGGDASGGKEKDPEWEAVFACLKNMEKGCGSLTLSLSDKDQAKDLQVFSQRGLYVLLLGADDGEEYSVRTYNRGCSDGGRVEVLGDMWDSSTVCEDFCIVVRAFKVFLNMVMYRWIFLLSQF